MYKHASITVALAAGALFAPAGAQAHVDKGVSSVKAHTVRADAALERAVSLYDRHAAARADRSFALSRRELGAAAREAAALRRAADTPAEELQAARAVGTVAAEQDENVEKLAEALDGAKGRSERKVAAAALSDVRGRDKAVAVLTAVLDEVPEQAQSGIARSIASLSTGRDDEVEALGEALAGGEVGAQNQRTVAQSVRATVDGQAKAGERLAALVASDDVPEAGKAGLRKAYDAVNAEHGAVADVLSRFSDRMPAKVRSFVEQIVTQAREDAQSLRESRPTPPSEQPEGQPSGQPESTPTGQPESTPTGDPGTRTRP